MAERKKQFGKRFLDLVVSIPLMVLLSPFYILATLLVACSMGRPVFFRQQRPGLKGKPFTVLKFRTMNQARDAGGKLKPDGERLTPIGKLLRKTSLDELPQLWNVLRGEMSLVGPRPLLMEYLERYTTDQMRRHDVMPGITGWAQIGGRTEIPFSRRLQLDLWYVDHWCLWLDVLILTRTVSRVLFSRGVKIQILEEVDDLGLHPETGKRGD